MDTYIFTWKSQGGMMSSSVPIRADSMLEAVTIFRAAYPSVYKSKDSIRVERAEEKN